MRSSKPSKTLFDPIRGEWVAATPEEVVRQQLLQRMVRQLGFPKELIAVEKEIAQLAHVAAPQLKRRADIICFAKGVHPTYPLYPLLLIECKEAAITQEATDQLLGYNHTVKAFYVALAGEKELSCGIYDKDKEQWRFLPYLPTYEQLLKGIGHGPR